MNDEEFKKFQEIMYKTSVELFLKLVDSFEFSKTRDRVYSKEEKDKKEESNNE
jgi:hypothetical protein